MALVGKPRCRRGVGERRTRKQHPAHRIEPTHRQITVGARAVEGAKVVRQTPTIAARRGLEFEDVAPERLVRAEAEDRQAAQGVYNTAKAGA